MGPDRGDIVADDDHAYGIVARVERVLTFGATARVELTGITENPGDTAVRHYEVEVARTELAGLDLAEGTTVRLLPSQLRIFENTAAAATGRPS